MRDTSSAEKDVKLAIVKDELVNEPPDWNTA